MANKSAERDPTDLDALDELQEQRELEERKRRHREVEDFKWLMAHAQGRRFVWRLLELAGVFRTSFTGNSETFFREGMRNMGLVVLAEVHELVPEAFVKMLKENKTDERN